MTMRPIDAWRCGLYTTGDVRRLTGVPAHRVRTWATPFSNQPLWLPSFPLINHKANITFFEMLEVIGVALLTRAGFRLQQVREFRQAAAVPHPLINRSISQPASVAEALASLLGTLEFAGGADLPCCWWPLGKDERIAIDPIRSFGDPILPAHGIPTRALAGPVLAGNETIESSASWWEVTIAEVEAAVEFERWLAKGTGFLDIA